LESGSLTVRASLAAVIHGLDNEDGHPASLIIFNFDFLPVKAEVRFKHAAIAIQFSYQDADEGPIDPQVVNMAPYGLFRLEAASTSIETTITAAPGVTGGLAHLGPVSASASFEQSIVREVKDFATITGWKGVRDRNSGESNTAEWALSENTRTRSGIATHLTAVVLLRRIDNTSKFLARCSINVKTAGGSWAQKILRTSIPLDDPIVFDPGVAFPGKLDTGRLDIRNLESVDIQKLSKAVLGMHTAVGSPRDEEEGVRRIDVLECNHDTATVGPGPSKIGAGIDVTPIAEDAVYQEKHTTLVEIGYGRNLNEKLFNIASGKVQDVWCKFKRFDRLSLLNLCHYQDKLVELEGKIQKDPSNMTKEQIKELAELLREYHAAIKAFKDIWQMPRPEPGTPKTIVDRLCQMIGGEHGDDYAYMQDSPHMVDLSPDALNTPSDPVRRRFQMLFGPVDGENDRTQPFREGEVPPSLGKPTPSQINARVDKAVRYLVSYGGGLLLLAPMYILSFVHTQSYQLIAVTLFVLSFATIVGMITTGSNSEVLAATATYAAILVVFLSGT